VTVMSGVVNLVSQLPAPHSYGLGHQAGILLGGAVVLNFLFPTSRKTRGEQF
jgi:heme A synthase